MLERKVEERKNPVWRSKFLAVELMPMGSLAALNGMSYPISKARGSIAVMAPPI